MKDEPIFTVAGIVSVVAAVLALLTHFDIIHLTDDQSNQILTFASVLAPLVIAFIARHWTFPAGHVVAYQSPSGLVVAGDASPIVTGTPVDVEANGSVGEPEEEDAEHLDD